MVTYGLPQGDLSDICFVTRDGRLVALTTEAYDSSYGISNLGAIDLVLSTSRLRRCWPLRKAEVREDEPMRMMRLKSGVTS